MRDNRESRITDALARDELHYALALSGSLQWGTTSTLILPPLPAGTTREEEPQINR
ncbi:hypothetical protein SAMN05421595_2792 [Austwickia chelonae]|uniref:Uncharacterized protein n=1 Tax=Austwickia chelonae NBRC 105200 TaxID=1184607 RepID=K6VP94_9MICO|nr:hypothetical protein [Austwickia chelonae]GAB78519.1 hypothetical protein AUCHE_09_01240 [Austwickia chelonae NBRC 105200]SEW40343.1 hypothetical protein SAMN05421595_2792 [Austwickia chelonae]